MKAKSLILLAVALCCGLVAMLGVQQVLSKKEPHKQDQTVQVLVAMADIGPGMPLDDTNTAFKSFPKDGAPEGAVMSAEQFKDRSLKVGAVPGEIIMKAKLGAPGVFGASSEIPEGMRVITVPVDLTKTHSGLIRPGDRVDIMLTYSVRVPGEGPSSKVRTVLEFIKVFAADNLRASGGNETSDIKAKNISLLVDPEQAKLLMMASSLGQLHLALRHKMDDVAAAGKAVTLEEFEGMATTSGTHDPFEGGNNAEGVESTPSGGDVRTALANEMNQQSNEPAEKTVEASAVEVAEPKWKIHIFAGSEHRVEEVDLPAEEQPATAI